MLPTSQPFGVPGLGSTPGEHICAFYPSLADRDDILIPYLREGLDAGDKCICVVDATDPEAVFAALSEEPGRTADLTSCLDRNQLDVRRSRDTYLASGAFHTEAMLEFWERSMGQATAGGYETIRAAGEMTWALRGLPGADELVAYEAELNRLLPRFKGVILCLYDLDRFSGNVLVDILKTHPQVLFGGLLLDNPYYIEPDEFLAGRSAGRR